MAFKTSGIDFAKRLWEQHRIKYGPKDSYCAYPRQFKTRGLIDNEKVIPVSLRVDRGHDGETWVYVEEGAVTGYESARLADLWFRQGDWVACAGGMGWRRLDIRKEDLVPVLREIREWLGITP